MNPGGPTITWEGFTPLVQVASLDESTCIEGANCDTYTLTLSGTPADWTGKRAQVKVSWPNSGDDFDVFVHKGNNTGPIVGSSASSGSGPEVVGIDPANANVGTGVFTVHVVYFLVAGGHKYSGEASVQAGTAPTPTPSPGSTPTPTPIPPGTPRYHTFAAPPGTGEDAGEPSIGVNWLSENIVRPGSGHTFANSNGPILNGGTSNYYGGFLAEMLRVTFDDCSSPANAFWEKKPLVLAATPRALGDPILHTNRATGRTFVSQEESQVGSTTDVTDNDGETFEPSVGAGPPAGVDHQTVGSGPYAGPTPPTALFPATGPKQAVYFASQSISDARCSRSDDGGITFGPAVPMYTIADCAGLHGHLKVAPDGTVYVPDKACAIGGVPFLNGGNASAVVSMDNGITWNVRPIPDAPTPGEFDPSIGIASDGKVYLGYQGSDGHARISVSSNKGVNWSVPYDVGAQLGIENIAFPAVVAGDSNRAAFAFFGSTTSDAEGGPHDGGPDNDPNAFTGVWYLYVASTFDGGQSWTTVNVTPNDPIQRGPICGDSTCRNLLDFFDATVDKRGRVVVGWEDGCVGGCVLGGANSFTAKATISRQSGGKRLFAEFDPVEPAAAGAPAVSGFVIGNKIQLSWPVPDGGGATITGYKVFRSAAGGPFLLLTTVNVPNYTDSTFNSAVQNLYRVTALNNSGAGGAIVEGPYCKDFLPPTTLPASPCSLPGIQTANDVNADGTDKDSAQNTPVDGSVNIKQLFVAEPFIAPGVDKLYFTLQVAPSTTGSAPPNSQWFMIWNRQGAPVDANDAKFDRLYVAMRTDAAGTPTFEYGKFGIPINTSPPPLPDPSANSPSKIGDADTGSYNPLTGVIRLEISNSKLRAVDGGATKYVAATDLAALNVRTYFNRPDPGQRSQNNASDISDDSTYTLRGNAFCAPVADLVSAVSRKTHGLAGPFDVRLVPADGNNAVECRDAGPNGDFQIVATFASPVTFTSASTDAGTISNTTANGNTVTVNLTGVTDAQKINVTLTGLSAGGTASPPLVVPMSILAADTTGDTRVNIADTNETKLNSGQLTDVNNFRNDVNRDGRINVGDTNFVKARSGRSIVAPPRGERKSAK